MPENVNHVQVHEVLACNLFNVITLVQEAMQKIVSDNSHGRYIIHGERRGEKYRVTNRHVARTLFRSLLNSIFERGRKVSKIKGK